MHASGVIAIYTCLHVYFPNFERTEILKYSAYTKINSRTRVYIHIYICTYIYPETIARGSYTLSGNEMNGISFSLRDHRE